MEMRGTPAQGPLMSIHDVMDKALAGVKPVGSVDLSMPICSELFFAFVAASQTPDPPPGMPTPPG
jgi:hypothetical protein